MNAIRLLPFVAAIAVAASPAQSQFDYGAVYLMSVYHAPAGGSPYPGIARVDPTTGAVTPFVQFSTSAYQASAVYDPYRDRIVAFCGVGSMVNPAVMAFDASGNATQIANTNLVRLAARGDGKIYGYKAGAQLPTVQQIFYVDANGQEQTLLDVGGAAPWLWNGGVQVFSGDPIRAMIYEPRENALFIAFHGDNTVPDCDGIPSFDVSIRKVPLTADGTALRAPATCSSYDVAGNATLPTVDERPYGFCYGPNGTLVLTVYANWSGAMARFVQVEPVFGQITPFVTVGPYYGDIAIAAGVYSPLTDRALLLDGFNDVWRSFVPGTSGSGQVLAPYGSTGLGATSDSMFVVTPIGNGFSLTADTTSLSVTGGGVQNLDFHPGVAFANHIHLIVGSLSGWAPGFTFGGAHIPLNIDWYSDFTLSAANSAFLVNTLGFLAANGTTAAQVNYPAGVLVGLQGTTMQHAAIAFDGTLAIVHVSNPVALQLLP